jgi:cell volume regulation protein A
LIHSRGLRLRPRVGATLEVESGTNDPLAVFLTVMLVEILALGDATVADVFIQLGREAVLGTALGVTGGWLIVMALNRIALPQGMHAPFVLTTALAIFGLTQAFHGSGFLAVYLAGIVVGNRPTRAHSTVVVFLDAITWLAQIVMFVLLGLLAWPHRLVDSALPAIAVALVLMFVARPLAVMVCLAPFRFPWREKVFISWVGLRGAVGIFLASIPLLVDIPNAAVFFDVAFVVVLISLLVQGWSLAPAARWLHVALPRSDRQIRRIELDLPGQLEQELVGYGVRPNSLFMRRNVLPSWSKPTLVVRNEKVLSPAEANPIQPGDYIYLLAPPEKAPALDRFFADMPPVPPPDPRLLGDFFLPGEVTLGQLVDIYGVPVPADEIGMTLSDYFDIHLDHAPRLGATLALGDIVLAVRAIGGGRVNVVALRLPGDDEEAITPPTRKEAVKARARRIWTKIAEG